MSSKFYALQSGDLVHVRIAVRATLLWYLAMYPRPTYFLLHMLLNYLQALHTCTVSRQTMYYYLGDTFERKQDVEMETCNTTYVTHYSIGCE
jgi:hypothetical protein